MSWLEIDHALDRIYQQDETYKVSLPLHFIPNSKVGRNYSSDQPMKSFMYCSLSMKEARAMVALLSHFPKTVAFAMRIMWNAVQIRNHSPWRSVAKDPREPKHRWMIKVDNDLTLDITPKDIVNDDLGKFYLLNPLGVEFFPRTPLLGACCAGGNFKFLEHFLLAHSSQKILDGSLELSEEHLCLAPANVLELILCSKHVAKFDTSTLFNAVATCFSQAARGDDKWSMEDSFRKIEVIKDFLETFEVQWKLHRSCRLLESTMVTGLVQAAKNEMNSSRFSFFLRTLRFNCVEMDQESRVKLVTNAAATFSVGFFSKLVSEIDFDPFQHSSNVNHTHDDFLPPWTVRANLKVMKHLLDGGLALGSRFRTRGKSSGGFHQTLLEKATYCKDEKLLKLLLSHPNYKIDICVETALRGRYRGFISSEYDTLSPKILKLLLDHDDISPAGRSPCGLDEDAKYPTALHHIVSESYFDFSDVEGLSDHEFCEEESSMLTHLRALLEKSTPRDLRCENHNRETPLHIAVQSNNKEAVELLIKGGAELRDDLLNVPCTNPALSQLLWRVLLDKWKGQERYESRKPSFQIRKMSWVDYQRQGLHNILDEMAAEGIEKYSTYQLFEYYFEKGYFQDATIFSPATIEKLSSTVLPFNAYDDESFSKACLVLLWTKRLEEQQQVTQHRIPNIAEWKDAIIMECLQDFASGDDHHCWDFADYDGGGGAISSLLLSASRNVFIKFPPHLEEGGFDDDDDYEFHWNSGYISSMEGVCLEELEELSENENFGVSRCFSPLSYAIEKQINNFVLSLCTAHPSVKPIFTEALSHIKISDENRRRVVNYDGPGDRNGMTPLKRAIRQGNSQLVALLLQAGADPNLNDPLSYAIRVTKDPRETDLFTILLAAGAVPSARALIDSVIWWDDFTARIIIKRLGKFFVVTDWDRQLPGLGE